MFALITGLWKWLTQKKELRFLIVGIDNAGKTTTLEQIKHIYHSKAQQQPLDRITPTIGLNLCHVKLDPSCMGVFWDLGGQLMLRGIWENHYSECDGLLFVLDSTDIARLPEVKKTFEDVMSHNAFTGRNVPIALFINKQDAESQAYEMSTIIQLLGLTDSIANAKIIEYPSNIQKLYSNSIIPSHPSVGPVTSPSFRNNHFNKINTSIVWKNQPQVVCISGCSAVKNINLEEAIASLVAACKTLTNNDYCRLRIIWKEPTPYGVRGSKSVRAGKMMVNSAKQAELLEEQKKQTILLDGKKQFRFSLKQNYGIGWTRSLQILKHLEMHEHAPSPDITPKFKQRVLGIVAEVKKNKLVWPNLPLF